MVNNAKLLIFIIWVLLGPQGGLGSDVSEVPSCPMHKRCQKGDWSNKYDIGGDYFRASGSTTVAGKFHMDLNEGNYVFTDFHDLITIARLANVHLTSQCSIHLDGSSSLIAKQSSNILMERQSNFKVTVQSAVTLHEKSNLTIGLRARLFAVNGHKLIISEKSSFDIATQASYHGDGGRLNFQRSGLHLSLREQATLYVNKADCFVLKDVTIEERKKVVLGAGSKIDGIQCLKKGQTFASVFKALKSGNKT